MGTLQRYILRSFLVAAGLTGLVLTFVLSVGFLFQVFQFVMRGAPAGLVCRYLAASMPEVLGFTIPLALMVASLLVFGRLSTDSEVAAMKACGVSFLTIMRGPVIVGLICSAIGFYLQNYAMPRGHFVRRSIASELAVRAGVDLIEPGRFIDEIDHVTIFCDRKVSREDEQGKKFTTIYNVLAIDRSQSGKDKAKEDPEGGRAAATFREIQASRADMRTEGSDLVFTLYDCVIAPSPVPGVLAPAKIDSWDYRCKGVISRTRKYVKKPKDYDFGELLAAVREFPHPFPEALPPKAETKAPKAVAPVKPVFGKKPAAAEPVKSEPLSHEEALKIHARSEAKMKSRLLFLLNYRTVWALSAICFVLVGVPLGCQTQRKESARGMALGVGIGITFFLFVLLSEALADKPKAFPWLLVWVPVVASLTTAVILIRKHQ